LELHSNFEERVIVHSTELDWVDSPIEGVQRRMLDRVGDEVARATTIVKYDPGSHFSPHIHTGGEEFLVLEGVFQDEHGDFPAGSYIRNPPESRHTPGSEAGCTIFVKLWQFDPTDRTHVRLQIEQQEKLAHNNFGQESILHQDAFETVKIEYWPANSTIEFVSEGGSEFLVLDGDFTENGDELRSLSWLRIPENYHASVKTGELGATVWRKDGHLKNFFPVTEPT
jgi:anti-sigma factor ChrR (cupin superfamily)